jgi:hypothetical protein
LAADRCEVVAAEACVVANGLERVAYRSSEIAVCRPGRAARARRAHADHVKPIPTSAASVQTPAPHRSDSETLSGSQAHANRLMDQSVAVTDRWSVLSWGHQLST